MVTTTPPIRYSDPEVQKAHIDLYLNSSDRPLYPVLPPDVTQDDFDKAIQELVDVLGSKNVFAGEALQDYIDPYEIDEAGVERKIPSAAVWFDATSSAYMYSLRLMNTASPSSVEALQGVLKVANQYGIPVWTFSRGKNIGQVYLVFLCQCAVSR